MADAGDVNDDGFSDVIFGSREYSNGETSEGRAFVFYGSSTGLHPEDYWYAESDQEQAFFGYSVASAGDVNGDGADDVIIGAKYYDETLEDEGAAFLYYGTQTRAVPLLQTWSLLLSPLLQPSSAGTDLRVPLATGSF